MSNYLNSLVVRQLDSESLMQPRLPSLFEPPAFVSLLPHEQLVAVDSHAAVEPVAPIEPGLPINTVPDIGPITVGPIDAEGRVVMQPAAGTSINTISGPPSSTFSSSPDEAPGTVWRGPQTIESIASLPAEPAPDKPDYGESQVRGPQIQMASVPLEMPTTTKPLTPLSAVAPETPPVPWRNSRQPLSARPAIEREGKADQATSARLIPTTINETAIDETRRGVDSTNERRMVQPLPPVENWRAAINSLTPAPLPTSEPAPVINVTIGRIEVRATTPTTPPRKQPSAKPLMSLDEYLRRRTRGGGV